MSSSHLVPTGKPSLYGDMEHWAVVEADSLTFLPQLPDSCVEVIITDPPYGIGFAGAAWDSGQLTKGEAFSRWTCSWASECLRLLKPGGYLVAFGAPRTFYRLVVGVENAGFEIRDQLLWLFGTGVPKSRRMAGDLGTALKPAYEPILLARRPFAGPVATNLARHGTGALNIGASRSSREAPGRWPANVTLSHEEGCTPTDCAEACAVALLDQLRPGQPISRLFYCAKASRAEREAGCEQLPAKVMHVMHGRTGGKPRRNIHPTVKPLALMRWLVALACPVGGLVFDPFAGSGSTGVAAVLEQRQFFGIEREPDYVAISCARLAHWTGVVGEGKKAVHKRNNVRYTRGN
jgi:site-specific DNA-methyltransferase (adenine-specific)